MAVKMRLRREGKKKQPSYRVVVADSRSPRDGRYIEDLGYYHPLREPSAVEIDTERALHWLKQGVQPSEAVVNILRIAGVWEQFRPDDAAAASERAERRAAKRKVAEDAKAKKIAEAEAAAKAEREARLAEEAAAAQAAADEAAAEAAAAEAPAADAPAEDTPAPEAAADGDAEQTES